MGWIISGFLSSGKLSIDQDLFWYDYDKLNVQVNSIYAIIIHKEIEGPATLTLTLKKLIRLLISPDLVLKINYSELKNIRLLWIYFNDVKYCSENDITIYIKNQILVLKKELVTI